MCFPLNTAGPSCVDLFTDICIYDIHVTLVVHTSFGEADFQTAHPMLIQTPILPLGCLLVNTLSYIFHVAWDAPNRNPQPFPPRPILQMLSDRDNVLHLIASIVFRGCFMGLSGQFWRSRTLDLSGISEQLLRPDVQVRWYYSLLRTRGEMLPPRSCS